VPARPGAPCYPRDVGYFLLVAAAGLAELASLVLVGTYVGWLWMFGLLALSLMLGVGLLSGRTAATVRDVVLSIRAGRSPGPALLDGAMLAVAGVLFITPGFASDGVGLALMLPPVRAAVRRWLKGMVQARLARRGVPGAFMGHSEGEDPAGIEVIDVSGTEQPERARPRGPSLPS
jgi:UPF0716 protein FxsA